MSGDFAHSSGAEIVVARDLDDWTARAARLFVTLAHAATARDRRFTVALSGGSTPKRLYEALTSAPFIDDIPWHNVFLYWGDERHVPPDDPQSNYRMVRETLLDHVAVPPENVYRIHAELPPDQAAGEYTATLRGSFQLAPDARPRFELILLGLGDDGHTASLFPHTDVLRDSSRLVAAPWVDKLDTYRITLTVPVINNAAHVVFLVNGDGKAEKVHEVVDGPRQPDLLPAQLVAPHNGALIWMLDTAAARLLSR